ncbi:MAG: class I SAM-dependent methyltransferase [Bdellovibrionota bacterium]
MHGLGNIDPGMKIDWGKTSLDYAQYRPGPPLSFYSKLQTLGVGKKGQRILDLGTGTGVLARQFAKQGCLVTGTDLAPEQIKMAETLASMEHLAVTFKAVPTEEISFSDAKFDAITANQCFLYFDKTKVVPLIKKYLAVSGVFVTSHFSWLPLIDKIAHASEQLILKHNPNWTAHSFKGVVPLIPYGLGDAFEVVDSFYYDQPIEFTREEWRGRIRASRGIGAALLPDQIELFDREHEELLKEIAEEKFQIIHRIDAHIMSPK